METVLLFLSLIFMGIIIYHLVNYYNLKKLNKCEILYKIKEEDVEEVEEVEEIEDVEDVEDVSELLEP